MFKFESIDFLGGGFNYFLCSTRLGEMIQFDWYFSKGLKPPTSFQNHQDPANPPPKTSTNPTSSPKKNHGVIHFIDPGIPPFKAGFPGSSPHDGPPRLGFFGQGRMELSPLEWRLCRDPGWGCSNERQTYQMGGADEPKNQWWRLPGVGNYWGSQMAVT